MATAAKHLTLVSPSTVSTLTSALALREAGFAVHWLHPRTKEPAAGKGWPDLPVATTEQLRATYRPGMNVGIRTGEPSQVDGMYVHVFDVDIRFPDLADEAWAEFDRLLPGIRESLPSVVSGSGGESRHLYFLTDKPFSGHKIAKSLDKHRTANGGYTHNWEIDLFGSRRQLVAPPSIHPDTGLPYRWEREWDLDGFDQPIISGTTVESLGVVAEDHAYTFEYIAPRQFDPGEIEKYLDDIPSERWEERDDWWKIGMALHHQFGGSQEGFDLWMRYSAKSEKHLKDSSLTKELRRYRGFGRNQRLPVTMGTVQMWVDEARKAANVELWADELDDLEDHDTADDFNDLLTAPAVTPAAVDDEAVFSLGLGEKDDWWSRLAFTDKGGIVANLPNIELIMKNDPRLAGLPQRNEFTQETVQRTMPGVKARGRKSAAKETRQLSGSIWDVRDTLNGEPWSTARDYAIRSIIETPKTQGGYDLKVSDRDLKAATVLAAYDACFHPVREFLQAQTWDGAPRVDKLFIDYLGAEDNAYTRQVARLMMVAAVARVFEPGCKWDHAVILEGVQGVGKSTFIRILGRKWSVELEGNFHDPKEMVEKLQGGWVVELPELSGFSRADVQSIKAFVSRQFDKVRLAYEARAQEFPRQSILIGSTNDREYLRDATGGRRFFPMECHVEAIDNARFRLEVDQLWAEAMHLYSAMRADMPLNEGDLPLYLSGDALVAAGALQESRRVETVEDGLVGRIAAWLETPVLTGSLDDDGDAPQFRNVTCYEEVYRAVAAEDKSTQRLAVQRALGMVPGWKRLGGANSRHQFPNPIGRQRCFERIGSAGRMQPVGPK